MGWLGMLGGLLSDWQRNQQMGDLRAQLLRASEMQPAEEASLRTQGTANVTSALNKRGLLDSGILGSSIAGIEPEIARIKGQRAQGGAGVLSGLYGAEASQPSAFGNILGLIMRYGQDPSKWGERWSPYGASP